MTNKLSDLSSISSVSDVEIKEVITKKKEHLLSLGFTPLNNINDSFFKGNNEFNLLNIIDYEKYNLFKPIKITFLRINSDRYPHKLVFKKNWKSDKYGSNLLSQLPSTVDMVREWYIKPKSINDQQLYRSCSAAISSSNGKKTPSSVSCGIKLRKKSKKSKKSKKKLKNKTKKNNTKKYKTKKNNHNK